MTDTTTIGFELITLNGVNTYTVEVEINGTTETKEMSEPFYVKGITKTGSVITFTDSPISSYASMREEEPSFQILYSRTAYGTAIDPGDTSWELTSYKSTPYGAIYKNESNWRSVPNDLFK